MTFKLPIVLAVASLMPVMVCPPTPGQRRPKSGPESISVSRLNRGRVIGSLGRALGEVVTVEGEIADGSDTRRKADEGKLLLRVRAVNGRPLKPEVVLDFSPFPSAEIRNPAAGAAFKYTGYETGGFSGVPEAAFKYAARVATAGYHFTTSFVILRDEHDRQ